MCILMGLLGVAIYSYAEAREERFRKRTLAFFKSFTLPWFAILGPHKSLDHGLGIYGAITIGLISTTAGGVLNDVCSDVTPEVLRPSEHIVTAKYALTKLPTDSHYIDCAGSICRVVAVKEHWAQIVPYKAPPAGTWRARCLICRRCLLGAWFLPFVGFSDVCCRPRFSETTVLGASH